MIRKIFISLLAIVLSSSILAQGILDQQRVSFRFKAKDCGAYYVPNSPTKGIPLDVGTGYELTHNENHSLDFFQKRISKLVKEIGEEDFLKGRFYITGEDKRAAKSLLVRQTHYKTLINRAYKEVLNKEINLADIDLKIISRLSGKFSWDLEATIQKVSDKITGWFPSKLRHWEAPTRREVAIALVTTAMIETLTAGHIVSNYTGADMWTLLITHASLLITYDVVKRGMTNWIIDPNISYLGKLNKQLLSSFPFLLSFAIAGNITGVIDFFQTHDALTSMDIIVRKNLPEFLIKSLPVSVLQTVFYLSTMTKWLGAWWSHKPQALRMKAKDVQEVIKIPILLINSYFFALASTGANPIWDIGEYGTIGVGHLGIGIMALAGMTIAKFKPNLLDPLIKKQDWILKKWNNRKEFRALFTKKIRTLLKGRKKLNN